MLPLTVQQEAELTGALLLATVDGLTRFGDGPGGASVRRLASEAKAVLRSGVILVGLTTDVEVPILLIRKIVLTDGNGNSGEAVKNGEATACFPVGWIQTAEQDPTSSVGSLIRLLSAVVDFYDGRIDKQSAARGHAFLSDFAREVERMSGEATPPWLRQIMDRYPKGTGTEGVLGLDWPEGRPSSWLTLAPSVGDG